jgi:hypothetical protein
MCKRFATYGSDPTGAPNTNQSAVGSSTCSLTEMSVAGMPLKLRGDFQRKALASHTASTILELTASRTKQYIVALDAHRVDLDRCLGWLGCRLAGSEVETGIMQRAHHLATVGA